MLAVENQVTNKTGVFPATVAKNASGAGATDGTEYVAPVLNNGLWGWLQDLIQQAGQTPNGVTEAAAATGAAAAGTGQQIRQALEMKYGAPGELVFDCIVPGSGTYGSQSMAWGAAAGGPPARYQYRRVIACAGQTVLAANYPDLCAALYCGDANNAAAGHCYYSSDNLGVTHSTSSKTYFTLPDFRGVTVRGVDRGTPIRDPRGNTRGGFTGGEIASLQQDALQGHKHGYYISAGAASGANGYIMGSSTSTGRTLASGEIDVAASDGTHGTPRLDSETRMYNASCNIGMRY